MQAAAITGYCFHRKNGKSVEYAMPSSRLPSRVASKGVEFVKTPIARAKLPVATTWDNRANISAKFPVDGL